MCDVNFTLLKILKKNRTRMGVLSWNFTTAPVSRVCFINRISDDFILFIYFFLSLKFQ